MSKSKDQDHTYPQKEAYYISIYTMEKVQNVYQLKSRAFLIISSVPHILHLSI